MSNLAEIGQILKQAREQQGLSLDEAAQSTRISRRYLVNIEEGNTLELPEAVYVRSFIKKYAKYLGIPGEELAEQYGVETPKAQGDSSSDGPGWGWLPLTATLILLAALGVAWWISRPAPRPLPIPIESPSLAPASPSLMATGELPASPSVSAAPSVTEAPSATPVPSVTATPSATAAPSVDATVSGSLTVSMLATADCWVEVIADGKTVFSDVLKSKENADWKAKKSIQITVGNAGGALLKVNNQDVGSLGKPGEVVTQVFNAKE